MKFDIVKKLFVTSSIISAAFLVPSKAQAAELDQNCIAHAESFNDNGESITVIEAEAKPIVEETITAEEAVAEPITFETVYEEPVVEESFVEDVYFDDSVFIETTYEEPIDASNDVDPLINELVIEEIVYEEPVVEYSPAKKTISNEEVLESDFMDNIVIKAAELEVESDEDFENKEDKSSTSAIKPLLMSKSYAKAPAAQKSAVVEFETEDVVAEPNPEVPYIVCVSAEIPTVFEETFDDSTGEHIYEKRNFTPVDKSNSTSLYEVTFVGDKTYVSTYTNTNYEQKKVYSTKDLEDAVKKGKLSDILPKFDSTNSLDIKANTYVYNAISEHFGGETKSLDSGYQEAKDEDFDFENATLDEIFSRFAEDIPGIQEAVPEDDITNIINNTDIKKSPDKSSNVNVSYHTEKVDNGIVLKKDSDNSKICSISYEGKLDVSSDAVSLDYSTNSGYAAWSDFASAIRSIVIPEGTKYIGQNAFIGLSNVIEVEIPDTVTTIGRYAFNSLSSLESITLSANIKTIKDHAFYKCNNLETIYMPGTAIYLEDDILPKNSDVTIVSYKNTIAEQFADVNDVGFEDITDCDDKKSIKALSRYSDCDIVETDGLETGVACILQYHYSYQSKTLTVSAIDVGTGILGDSGIAYTKIDTANPTTTGNAWQGLKDVVETLYISKNIDVVNANAFYGFSRLKNIECSTDLKSITSYAFRNCNNLEKIKFKSDITYIDDFYASGNIPKDCIIYLPQPNSNAKALGYKVFSSSRTIKDVNDTDIIPIPVQWSDAINSYESTNGHRWLNPGESKYSNTACVVTSAAMLIERKAFLEGYESAVGYFNQATIDAIVKEIGDTYILVDHNWDFTWAGTQIFSSLKLGKDNYSAHFVQLVKTPGLSLEETLRNALISHPEGILVRGYYGKSGHAVLVTNYLGNGKYRVYDPAVEGVQERSFANINNYQKIEGYTMAYIA